MPRSVAAPHRDFNSLHESAPRGENAQPSVASSRSLSRSLASRSSPLSSSFAEFAEARGRLSQRDAET